MTFQRWHVCLNVCLNVCLIPNTKIRHTFSSFFDSFGTNSYDSQMKSLYFLLFTTFLLACNNPLSKKYNKETAAADMQAIVKSDSIAAQQIVVAVMKRTFAELPLDDMSYQALADEGKKVQEAQKKQEAEKAAEEAKARAAEMIRAERLNKAFGLVVTGLSVVPTEYSQNQSIKMRFENKSGKEIKAVKGALVLTDLFDREMRTFGITMDEPIKAGMNSTDTYYYDYNQFISEHTQLGGKTLSQVKCVWKPEKIIFADNSTLE